MVDAGCKDNTMDAVASMKLGVKLRFVTETKYAENDPGHPLCDYVGEPYQCNSRQTAVGTK